MNTDCPLPQNPGEEQEESSNAADSTPEYHGLFIELLGREGRPRLESLDKFVAAEIESMRQALADQLMLTLSQEVHLRLLDAGTVKTLDLLTISARGGTLGILTDAAGQPRFEGVYLNTSATGALLECVLWGAPAKAKPTERDLNELERQFLEPFVRTAARVVRETADAASSDEFGLEMLTGPKFRPIVETVGSFAMMEFEIQIAGSPPGSLLFFASCGSASLVGRMGRPQAAATVKTASRAVPNRRRELLGQMTVDVAVTLEGNRIRFSDLISLQVGDVIALESPLTQPLVGNANGAAVFAGTVSAHKGQRHYKIDSRLALHAATGKSAARAMAAAAAAGSEKG